MRLPRQVLRQRFTGAIHDCSLLGALPRRPGRGRQEFLRLLWAPLYWGVVCGLFQACVSVGASVGANIFRATWPAVSVSGGSMTGRSAVRAEAEQLAERCIDEVRVASVPTPAPEPK